MRTPNDVWRVDIQKILTLTEPITPDVAPLLQDAAALLIDASKLHADTVRRPEERCFSLYERIMGGAPEHHFWLMPPSPQGVPTAAQLLDDAPFFHSFLTAALRASAMGQVSLLLPQVQGTAEIRATRRMINNVMSELYRRGEPFDETTRLGICTGTRDALLHSRKLLEEADHLIIDTDALSRTIEGLMPQIQSIEIGVGNAHILNRFVALKGKLATDPRALPHLCAMGADALILPPPLP